MLLLTRFNEKTYEENKLWRQKNNWTGCVYGARNECVDNWGGAYVLEMNLETNKIMAVGIITHTIPPPVRKPWQIYTSAKYNKFIYFGKERYELNELDNLETKVIRILETALFLGKGHSKRGNSWRVPGWIMSNDAIDFESEMKSIANKRNHILD